MRRSSPLILWLIIGIVIGWYHKEIRQRLNQLLQLVAPRVMDWMTRQLSLAEIQDGLAVSGRQLLQQVMQKSPSKHNYQTMRHIIGIERWGQRRLQVVLGAPFVAEEYNDYRPPMGLSWNELQDEFERTRQDTVALVDALQEEPEWESARILHNEFGNFSVPAWLTYLRIHGDMTVRLMN